MILSALLYSKQVAYPWDVTCMNKLVTYNVNRYGKRSICHRIRFRKNFRILFFV